MHGGELIPNSIFVYGIPTDTQEDELSQFFVKQTGAGSIKDARIIIDQRGVSKGYGFVSFTSENEVNKILDSKNGVEKVELQFRTTKLCVSKAFKQKRHQQYQSGSSNPDGSDRYYLSPNSELMPMPQTLEHDANTSNGANNMDRLANELNDIKLSASPSTSPDSHNTNDNRTSTTSCSSASILLDNGGKNEANSNHLYTSESSSSSTTNLVNHSQPQSHLDENRHDQAWHGQDNKNSYRSNYKYKSAQYRNSNFGYNPRAANPNSRNNQNELHVQTYNYQNNQNQGPFSMNSLSKQHYYAYPSQPTQKHQDQQTPAMYYAPSTQGNAQSTAGLVSPGQFKSKTNPSSYANKRNYKNNDKINSNTSNFVGSALSSVGGAYPASNGNKSQANTPVQSDSSTSSSVSGSAIQNGMNNSSNSLAIAANYANHSASLNSSATNPQQQQQTPLLNSYPQQGYASNAYAGDFYANQNGMVQQQGQQQGQQYAIYPSSYYYLASQAQNGPNTGSGLACTGSLIPVAYQQQQQIPSAYYQVPASSSNPTGSNANTTTTTTSNNEPNNSTIKNALDTVISNSSSSLSTEQYAATANNTSTTSNMEAYKNYIAYQQQAQPAYYYVAQPYTAGGTPIATPLHLNTAQYYYYPQGPLSAGAQPLSQPQSQQAMQLISGPLSSNSAAFQLNPMTNQMAFNQQNSQSGSFQQHSNNALVSPRSTAYAQQQAQLAGQYQPKQQAHNASVPILQLPTLNYPFNQQTPGGITPNTMIQSPQQHASALQAQFSQQQSSYYLQQQQQAQAAQLTPKSAAKIDNNNNSLNRLNNNQRSLRNGSYNSSSGHFNKSARYNRPNNGYSSGGKQGFKSGGSANEAQLHDSTSDEQGMPVINSSHEASN